MSNNSWIERQSRTPEARRAYERERLAVWAFDSISEAMEQAGKSKADLARALETSRANITQLLSGERNVTLRTLADLAWACDSRIVLNIEPMRTGKFMSSPVRHVCMARPQVTRQETKPLEADAVVNNHALAA